MNHMIEQLNMLADACDQRAQVASCQDNYTREQQYKEAAQAARDLVYALAATEEEIE